MVVNWGDACCGWLAEYAHGLLPVAPLAAGYEGAQPRLIKVLERLTTLREKEVPPEYLYYGIPSPWLQVRVLMHT